MGRPPTSRQHNSQSKPTFCVIEELMMKRRFSRSSCRPARRRSLRGAFTLLEVMLVLVIIAAIAGIAVYNIGGIQNRAFTMTAKNQISQFKSALDQYRLYVGSYPSELDALYQQPADLADPSKYTQVLKNPIPADPWGNKYDYKLINSGSYELRSAGPDGQSNTDDDVT
jgi:general secretion pathway protein G